MANRALYMPPFAISAGGSLTDQQVDALVHGMRAAWFKAGTLDGANAPPYKAVKPADAAHGQQVYTTYCASCHGLPEHRPRAKRAQLPSRSSWPW